MSPFSKAKNVSSKSSNDGSDAPPAYSVNERAEPEPPIDLTALFSELKLSNDIEDPGVDTCLAHLKLLHAFQTLKEDVGYTDGLWGLWDTRAECSVTIEDNGTIEEVSVDPGVTLTEEQKKITLSKIREKRWALFVARAVERYEAWWVSMFKVSLTESEISEWVIFCESDTARDADTFDWSQMPLPPLGKFPCLCQAVHCLLLTAHLDVLMVFHAHMLNPRAFLEDSMRHGARKLWKLGMPWTQINAAIDENFNYHVSEDNKDAWVANTRRAWSNADDGAVFATRCPACGVALSIPWTTCGLEEHPKVSNQ